MTDYEAFVHELIGYIFKVQDKDDDNLSAEVICRKLYKYGLIENVNHKWRMKYRPRYVWPARIRKTEPQTDNGIGCSKCESRFWCMDRDMPHAVHCNNYGKTEQTEPQTEDCGACEHARTTCRFMECGEPCHFKPKDEPQTDLLVTEYPQDGEVNLIGKDKTEAVVMAYDIYKEMTEPQTERSE